MDYFDMEEAKQKEAEEKKVYDQFYEKQSKIARIVLLSTFDGLGGLFVLLGILMFALSIVDEEGFNPGIVFLPMGAFFILLGIILFLAIPKKGNYERYKKRVNRYGYYNAFNFMVSNKILEAKVQKLEEENKALENRLNELERRK